jgi:hypothetical protein
MRLAVKQDVFIDFIRIDPPARNTSGLNGFTQGGALKSGSPRFNLITGVPRDSTATMCGPILKAFSVPMRRMRSA